MHRLIAGLLTGTICLWPIHAHAQTVADVPTVTTSATELEPMSLTLSVPPKPETPLQLKIQNTRPLTLEEAISIVLERNPQLSVSRLATARSEAVVRQAEAALWPTVGFTVSYAYVQSAQNQLTNALFSQSLVELQQTVTVPPATTAAASEVVGTIFPVNNVPLNGQVNLNWNVFSSGLIPSRISAAQRTLEATRLDSERVRQDVLSNTINAYYDLQAADGNLEITESAVRAAEATVKDAESQVRNGVATRFAVLQAEVQLANARTQGLQARSERLIRQRALARLLNFAEPTEVTAADPIQPRGTWQPDLEQSILQAYNQRQELTQQLALEQAARSQEEAAYASTGPQVNVFATGQALENLIDPVTGLYTGYNAGVQVQWNAFDGGASRALADQAIADANTARARYMDVLNTIRFNVESSYTQLSITTERIDTATRALSAAEESLRLARRRFLRGVGAQTDVLVADRDLTQAKVNRLTAIIDYNRALTSLRRALGIL